jgi:maltooligosyltrehalose trehalohydrolase
MCANAAYWIDEFHLDGLRLDATQSIHDASKPHILAEITSAARTAARGRTIFIVAENEPQRIEHVRPTTAGGYGMDAVWNDDFHHSAVVSLLGRSEAYYTDYRGTPQEFISAVKRGFLYQGQWYAWQQQRRGTPALDVPPECFVRFLENHDQVANTGRGQRLHQLANPAAYRAMTALLLLAPGTPMLFQGQEFASSRPFLYFADHEPELAERVMNGRKEFVRQFPSLATQAMQDRVRDPASPATFEDCKLDWSERLRHQSAVALHRDLLGIRRNDPVISEPSSFDGAVLGADAFALRFFAEDGRDRLLLINLGRDVVLQPAPEPLLAEPAGCDWVLAWSSEEPKYGGLGAVAVNWNGPPTLPAYCALLFVPETAGERPDG